MANPMDKYSNLPGVKVEYENGNLYSDHQNLNASTKSILIMGSAIDGPVGEPVSVQSIGGPKAAEKLFGGMMKREEIETGEINPNTGEAITRSVKLPHQGNLIRAMYEVLRAGNEDVRLLRIDGKRAKTEIQVKNIDQELDQVLGVATGNTSFSKEINIKDNGRLSSIPVKSIIEQKEDGSVINEYFSQEEINGIILDVDRNPGSETVYFKPDVLRPGNKVKVNYNFNKRNYHEVTKDDDDGKLTFDPTTVNYFSSRNGFWSDDYELGHTINVFVDGTAIPQISPNGDWLWRPGKEDSSVEDPLKDMFTTKEFEQGGVRFTEAYFEEVDKDVYPEIGSSSEVYSDYFYYDEVTLDLSETYDVVGNNTTYVIDYLPLNDNLRVYYEIDGEEIELSQKTDSNPDGEYSMIYPNESGEQAKISIKAGSVPVGLKITAEYKTAQATQESPKLIVQGLHAGEVYGSLEDNLDPETIRGVSIDIRADITPEDPTGKEKIIYIIKPSDKKTSVRDYALEYRTRELKGIKTLNEFVNYVNNDVRNNIVYLTAENGDTALVQGIVPTNRPVFLGEIHNKATNRFELNIDDSKKLGDADRYPWLGTNGFYDKNNLESMMKLFDKLGGTYELVPGSVDEYEIIDQGIYSKIENYSVDTIVLVEANLNTKIGQVEYGSNNQKIVIEDPYKNFGTQLAQHCAITTAKSWETIGFIGVNPVKTASLLSIQEYIDELANSNVNDHFMYNESTFEHILNDEGDPIDIGHYLNVVFGPEVGLSNDKVGNYISNGAAIYAGLNSVLSVEVATTNKEIVTSGLRYNLSEAQHSQLIDLRYVTFEEKITPQGSRQYKVKDGVTAGQPNSDFQRLSTVNITHATVQLIRLAADPFIGLPNGLAQRNSLSTEIQANLDRLKENGVLQDFKFSLFTSQREKVLGNAFITLELVPEFETRRIYTSVGLRQSIGE